MPEKYLSTSALARQLHQESKALFTLLSEGGWMIKTDGHWRLTEKGKFEGGIYINHRSYGEYIAWPESVQGHPLLCILPEAPLSVSQIASKVNLPGRLVNLVLAECGWIKKNIRGWLLTSQGRILGAEQHFSDHSGIPYVTWPETLLHHPHFLAIIAQISGASFQHSPRALSGQVLPTQVRLMVENWLYLARVHHACDYFLDQGDQRICAHFFLPDLQVAIDIWAAVDDAKTLGDSLTKREFYEQKGYAFIEVYVESCAELDELLAKRLMAFGVAVY